MKLTTEVHLLYIELSHTDGLPHGTWEVNDILLPIWVCTGEDITNSFGNHFPGTEIELLSERLFKCVRIGSIYESMYENICIYVFQICVSM